MTGVWEIQRQSAELIDQCEALSAQPEEAICYLKLAKLLRAAVSEISCFLMSLTRRRKIVIGLIFSLAFSVIVVLSLLFQPRQEGMILMDSEDYSVALSIDNKSRVVGSTGALNADVFVFTWSVEKGVTILKEDEKIEEELPELKVNDLGQRIENVKENGKEYGYVIQKSGKRHKLSLLGGDKSYATAINNKGQIVGYVVRPIPWWKKWWNYVAYRLDLPQKYKFPVYGYLSSKAAIWTVPPEDD